MVDMSNVRAASPRSAKNNANATDIGLVGLIIICGIPLGLALDVGLWSLAVPSGLAIALMVGALFVRKV